jgi:hypothetical protein
MRKADLVAPQTASAHGADRKAEYKSGTNGATAGELRDKSAGVVDAP